MKDAARLAKSPAAQELFNMMQAQNPEALNRAMNQAAAGDYDQVRQSLAQLLSTPEIRALLEQLGG